MSDSILARLAREGCALDHSGRALTTRPHDEADLRGLWAEEPDASVLVEFLRCVDHVRFVQALLACGHEVLALVPDDERRPLDLLVATDGWLHGQVCEADVRRATRVAFEAAKETPRRAKGLVGLGPAGVGAVRAVANVGLAVYEPTAQEMILFAACALSFASDSQGFGSPSAERTARARLADVVRGAVVPPTYDELMQL